VKVCILGPVTTPSYFGGVAVFDEGLARGFVDNGCAAFLATDQKDAVENANSIVPVRKIAGRNFKRILEQEKPDYIIAQLAYAKHLFGVKTNAKKIYFLHAFFKRSYYGLVKSALAVIYQKLLIRQCDMVFSNSYFTDMINRDFFDIPSDAVFHVGVSDEFFSQSMSLMDMPKEKNSIFFAGRFVPAKGVDRLIEAAEILASRNTEYHMYIAGDGPEKKRLTQYVAEKGLPVQFVGRLNQAEIAKQYRKAEVFVSLDISEPYGIVFCEALMSNCRIACPVTGGQIEILNDYPERVAYVNARSAESIANGIEKMLNTNALAELTLEEKERFSYHHIATQMIGYFAKCQ